MSQYYESLHFITKNTSFPKWRTIPLQTTKVLAAFF